MKSFAACMLALAGTLGVVACTGSVNSDKPTPGGTGGSSAGSGGTAPGGGSSAATCRSDGSLAPARISLITDGEYTNMMRDVFGISFVPETASVKTGEYPLNEGAEVSSADIVKQYYRA